MLNGWRRPSKGFERQATLRQNVATICYQSTDSRQKLTRKKRQFAKTTIHFSFRQSDNCTFFLRRRHGCQDLRRPAWLFWSSIVCVYGGSVVQILTKTNHHSTLFTKELRAAVAVAVPASTPQPLTFMTLNSLETLNANDSTVLSTAVVLFQSQTALVVKPSLVAGLSRLHVCNSSSPFVTSTILQNELESHLSNIDIYLPSEMTFLFSAEVAL